VDRFARTHPRFDELGALIEFGLKEGYDLKAAYRLAVILDRFKKTPPKALYDAIKQAFSNARTARP
jgi:hypothetical protein